MASDADIQKADWPTLLEAARTGDSRALGEVCQRIRHYLQLTADTGLGFDLRGKMSGSDVVQQSLLEAQCDIEKFDGASESEFRAWVERILKNNLIDAARRYRHTQQRDAAREVSIDSGDRWRFIEDPQETASGVARRQETDQQLQEAISRLSERRRQIIEMRHRDAMSFATIGEKLGVSEPAARKLWSRAIEELRKTLDSTNAENSSRRP